MTDRKSPIEQALDLFFYAPLGLLMNAEEVLPELVEKGRQQVTVARMFGQFAVKQGQTEASKVVARVQEQFIGDSTDDQPAKPAPASSVPASAPASVNGASRGPTFDAHVAPTLAIPDYDSLSASQVVPRLEGLAATELDAVRVYEEVHRGRKTILNKIAQLQG